MSGCFGDANLGYVVTVPTDPDHRASRSRALNLVFLLAFTLVGALGLLWGRWEVALMCGLFAAGYLRRVVAATRAD